MLAELSAFARLGSADRIAAMDEAHPDWRIMLGNAKRTLSDAELLNRDYYRGRFASQRAESKNGRRMIFNWEDVPLSQ
jgi:N,N'-diacetyllegionaminate synthase